MLVLTFCWRRRDGVQELRNCGALVSVRVAVLNIDHVDNRWHDVEEDEAFGGFGRDLNDLKNAEVSGLSLKYVASENLRSD